MIAESPVAQDAARNAGLATRADGGNYYQLAEAAHDLLDAMDDAGVRTAAGSAIASLILAAEENDTAASQLAHLFAFLVRQAEMHPNPWYRGGDGA